MNKKLYFAAIAAVVLATGCGKNEVIKAPAPDQAITFGVYVPKTVTTKAGGEAGTQTIITLGDANKSGFGVFCYYSDNLTNANTNDYNAETPSNFEPNFMWNQQVKGNGGGSENPTQWAYTPLKYWPNEHNTSVTDDGIDKLTFFAYAPWVNANKTSGSVESETEGITTLSSNSATGDPTLTYVVPASITNHVDVLYADATSLKNLTRPATNYNVSFPFKHALTSVVFRVQTFIDGVNNRNDLSDVGSAVDEFTTVTLKEVYFGGASIYPSGTLNIATGVWTPVAAETKTFSKTDLTQSVTKTKTAITGIEPIMLIPKNESTSYNVRVVYDVRTTDNNLSTGSSTVTNNIKNTLDLTLAAGKKNIVDLVLGLTTVKVSATVTDWDETDAVEVDLPANVSSI